MPSVEQTIVDRRALPRLLIEGENLDEGETAHDLHHIILVVDGFAPAASIRLVASPHVGLQVRAGVRDKVLARALVVLGRGTLDNFMADSEGFG